MGTVDVTEQISTSREQALKRMLGELAGNDDLKRIFAPGARTGAHAESEHVVEGDRPLSERSERFGGGGRA